MCMWYMYYYGVRTCTQVLTCASCERMLGVRRSRVCVCVCVCVCVRTKQKKHVVQHLCYFDNILQLLCSQLVVVNSISNTVMAHTTVHSNTVWPDRFLPTGSRTCTGKVLANRKTGKKQKTPMDDIYLFTGIFCIFRKRVTSCCVSAL